MHVADISSPFVVQFTDSDAHPPMTVPIAIAAETGNHSGIGWRTKYSSDYGRCYSLEIEQEGMCHTNIFCFDLMLNSAAIFSITGNNEVDFQDEAQVEASRRVPHASSWTIHGTGHHLQGKREPICMKT